MRVGRLAPKVYLYSVVTALATIATFVASFHIMRGVDRGPPPFPGEVHAQDIWQRRQTGMSAPEVPRRGPFPSPQATLYDIDGKLITSTVQPPARWLSPAELHRLETEGAFELERGVVVEPVREDGRLVALGIMRHGPPPPELTSELMMPVGILALVFLLGTMVSARHVVKPLQHLADTAKRFGRGELGARSHLQRTDEIGDLGRALDDMGERVSGLMAVQQELLVNVSHELLTPLARIRVAVDLITDGEAAQAQEMMQEITHDLVELERLLDDVMTVARLDLSRLKDGAVMPVKPERVSAADLVEKAATRFRAHWATHGLVIDLAPGLPTLSADGVLLRRVLENILDNARKYSEAGTTILVRAQAREGWLSIMVTDHGIGIEAGDLKKVFTPFFRTDRSRSRATGGVGLGLALARRVAEAHGGSIEIASELDRGTTVTLSLPVSVATS